MEEDLVLRERKVYMSNNKDLRVEIIQLYYDILTVGHRRR